MPVNHGKILLAGLLLTACSQVSAVEPAGHMDDAQREALSRAVRGILVDSLPTKIEGSDSWGERKEVLSGLKLNSDQGRIRLDRRTKQVNHGLWRRWTVIPVEPEKHLRFEIVDARSIGPRQVAFELVASAPLSGDARLERWRYGVKMLNFAVEADATIEMRLKGIVDYRVEWSELGGRVVILPAVHEADLSLREFDLRRLGIIDGKLAEELGDRATDFLSRQLDMQERQVGERVNRVLTERREKLALTFPWSLPQGGWEGWLEKLRFTARPYEVAK